MSKKAKKYIAVLIAVAVCFCGFAFTALADTKPNYQYGRIQRAYTNDGGQGAGGYGADATGQGAGYESKSSDKSTAKIMLTFNLAGGSGLHNNYVEKGTKIFELIVPVRSGYDFAGWIVSGKTVSSSYEMDSDTFLTATWKKAESSSPEDGTTSEEGGEDESASSSANAGGLVSSAASSAASSSSSNASSQAPAAPAPYSMLFYLGILLVALGLGGIVMLIIRQFHNRGGRGGRGSSGGRQGGDNMTFNDISSFSDSRNSSRK